MIPDWMLERFRLDELVPAERAQVEQALAADPALRSRLEQLDADSREILATYPAARFAAGVQRRQEQPSPKAPSWRWSFAAVPAFALALLVAVVFVRPPGSTDEILLKGDPSLALFRLTASGPERLADQAQVHAHELVQVVFNAAGAEHAVVLSVDGAGHATLHAPTDGQTRVEAGQRTLPESFELDDAPGFERFFLVVDARPLSTAALLRAAAALAQGPEARTGPLEVPRSAKVRSVLLQKVPR